MKSLNFGSLKAHTTVEEVDADEAEDEVENHEKTKEDRLEQVKDHVAKAKPDVRIAEVTAKVIENSRGNKHKFVR